MINLAQESGKQTEKVIKMTRQLVILTYIIAGLTLVLVIDLALNFITT
jgi:hypothetical protein